MTPTKRTDPPGTGDERTLLESFLDYHRDTLVLKCEGLTDEQLRTATAAPSELTLLGLVRHLSDVERSWFSRTLAGEDVDLLYHGAQDPDGGFHDLDAAGTAESFAVWRGEVARARQLAAERSLDDTGVHRRSGDVVSLRWIYLHLIEEYARHNGHADLIRERIDGATGE